MGRSSTGYHDNNPKGRLPFCPFSLGIFLGTAALVLYYQQVAKMQQESSSSSSSSSSESDKKKDSENSGSISDNDELPSCQVVFVLGGPGSGKGTQCSMVQENYKEWKHESTGDLLRAAREDGGELGDQINACLAQGQLVPSDVTCKLIANAMKKAYKQSGVTKFLIDGFPRSKGNVDAWESTNMASKHKLAFVLYFECAEEVLVGRLLERGKTSGRSDDNIEVIRKRLETNQQETEPIVKFYEDQGKLRRVAADQPVERVYKEVEKLINKF